MEMCLTLVLSVLSVGELPLQNPGFDMLDSRTGIPAGWYYTSLPDQPHLVKYATEVIEGGDQPNRALAIHVAADHPDTRVAYNVHQELKGAEPGQSYRVTARVRTRGLSTLPMIVVQCVDATGSRYVKFARSPERKLTNDVQEWEDITAEIAVPDGTSAVHLRIGIPAQGNAGGTALIDRVAIATGTP